MPIVLASASPRRADLLRAAGFSFVVDPVDIDESVLPGETPEAHVRRLARGKAHAGARRHPSRTVLGADTVVVVNGRILGKPRDDADAAAMLGELSGRVHHVYTAVAVVSDGVVQDGLDVSAVTFAPMSPEAIAEYVASGEPQDKAGAYAIQGWAARYVGAAGGVV